jgi:putative ABC transport system permease protein
MNLVASGLSRITTLSIDGRVLGFAGLLTLMTGVISGLIPAWLASTSNLSETLNQGSRGSTEGKSRGRIRRALVVAEIALSLTLLVCSGLLVRSYLRLSRYDPGFVPQHAALARLQTRGRNYATGEQQTTFTSALLARLREIPGVAAAGATSFFPLAGTFGTQAIINVEGTTLTGAAARPTAFSYIVSPDYFRAMGIRLVTGRFFAESDDADHTRVAIINESLARRHFAGTDPIGKRINIGSGREIWRQIVGVVADVGQAYVGEPPPSQIYEAMPQVPQNRLYLVVRTSGDPASVLPLIKSQAMLVDPTIPLGDLITVESFYTNKFTSQRLTLQLLMAFAAIALVIAAVGIYGVIAFSVSQRTVEFGIRMALGAGRGDVLRLVLAEGALLVGLGLLIGVAATLVAGQAMEAALYETSGRDPAAIVLITGGFTLVAFFACWLPARRATKVDPLIALRAG